MPTDQVVQGARPRSQGAARSSSSRGLANWHEDTSRTIGLSLAPRTRKGYSAMSIEFQEFKKMVNLEPVWPAPIEHLQQFIVYLKGLAPGTIQGKLSASAFYAKINGYRDFSGDYCIWKMLEG